MKIKIITEPLLLSIFLFLFIGASIQFGNQPSEFSAQDNRLKIICPKCGYVFYNCLVDEIFINDPADYQCAPSSSKIVPLKTGFMAPICPFDGKCAFNFNARGHTVWTNKGLMPKRERPRL